MPSLYSPSRMVQLCFHPRWFGVRAPSLPSTHLKVWQCASVQVTVLSEGELGVEAEIFST